MGNPTRILAMDGGNGLNTADLLQRLELANRNEYLNQTNVFVGTSAGGINSLFFAVHDNPSDALPDIQQFWKDVNMSILGGIPADIKDRAIASNQRLAGVADPGQLGNILLDILGISQAALGCRSLFRNDVLKQFLIQYFGADTTLADLKRHVIIVSFQMDNGKQGIEQSWVPKLFTNLEYTPTGEHGAVKGFTSPDLNEKIVDVALRTSAAPLELPIYQALDGKGPGYVDGGLVANNPAMIALSAIVGTLLHGTPKQGPLRLGDILDDIYMLSVGTGRNLVGTAQFLKPEFTDGSAEWGYRQWLFEPSNLFVLIDAALQGGNEAVSWECNILMSPANFHRLNVPLNYMLVPDDPTTKAFIESAALWLENGEWFKRPGVTAMATLTPEPKLFGAARMAMNAHFNA
jgi:hypothetical protein